MLARRAAGMPPCVALPSGPSARDSTMRPPLQTLASLSRLLLLAGLALPAPARAAAEAPPVLPTASRVERSVVKVFSTVRPPDPLKPWTKNTPSEATGSGVVIEGRRILTNAHVVLYASQVQVQAHQAGDKVSATVEAIAPGIDLAVLKLEDPSFFDAHPPLERATTLPDLKEAVMAYGYPRGGSNLSITKGIVSRIEFAPYNFPVSGLRIQIDAAINPGNSGGPAVSGDKMIGLAFSSLGGAQNIGYIIPNEEIELFLADVADGRYDGKPALFDELQTLENPALRAFLKLGKGVQGVIVNQPWGGDRSALRRWDVITHIGDTPVDDQGMIQVGPDLRIRFPYLVQRLAKGGKVPLTVVRAGKRLPLQVPVSPDRPVMVPDLQGAYPPYFVYGPLVFSTASSQLLGVLGRALFSGPGSLSSPLVVRAFDPPAFPGEELVVVASPLLPHKLAKGYSSPQGNVLQAFNGVAVRNLRHLVELLRDCRDEFLVFDFGKPDRETLVFARADLLAADDEILSDNGIRTQGSAELMTVWVGKGR
jgi:S1-C subfamily serine protease